MAIYHCSFKVFSRGTGRSAVAGAAYRSGEKLHNEYDQVTHDYTNRQRNTLNSSAYRSGEVLEHNGKIYDFKAKKGIIHSEIMLPENAPREFYNREKLWNAVEKAERRKDSQLCRECEMSLPVELNLTQQIELTRDYTRKLC